jgi:signal transduction histidine kinase
MSCRDQPRTSRPALAPEARTAAVGAVAASIAHELNQPLGAVVLNAQTCLRYLRSRLSEAGPPALCESPGHPRRCGRQDCMCCLKLYRRVALCSPTLARESMASSVRLHYSSPYLITRNGYAGIVSAIHLRMTSAFTLLMNSGGLCVCTPFASPV